MIAAIDAHTAAGNLLLALHTLAQLPDGSQVRIRLEERYTAMLEQGARAGLAGSAGELELMVADVVEILPLPDDDVRGGVWIWLMQARFILARRLGAQPPAVAA